MANFPQNMVDEAYKMINDIEDWQRRYSDFFTENWEDICDRDLPAYNTMVGLTLRLQYFASLALDVADDAYTLQALLTQTQGRKE